MRAYFSAGNGVPAAIAAVCWIFTCQGVVAAPQHAEDLPAVTLREVAQEHLLGLHKESKGFVEKIRKSADKYTQWKKGSLPEGELATIRKQCEEKPSADDFCLLWMGMEPLVATDDANDLVEENSEVGPEPLKQEQVRAEIKSGNLSALSKIGSSPIYTAMRGIRSLEELNKIKASLLDLSKSKTCGYANVLTPIAQKYEMDFSKPDVQSTVFALYEKLMKCDELTEMVEKGIYRYGLLKLMQGDHATGEKAFRKLQEMKSIEFGSRIYYWLARFARLRGDTSGADLYAQKLLKEFPLSYHSILINRKNLKNISRVLGMGEPTVLMRSPDRAQINPWIRMVEALAMNGEDDLARRLLTKASPTILQGEPRLRLYLAIVADKLGDPITQFRILGTVFRDDPQLITQNTLKLFYPLKQYETLRKNEGIVDPLFVASLIRQESGFNPSAMSPVGARGLMQLMPGTAKSFERVSKKDLFRPSTNIRIGTRLISRLVEQFDQDAELALAAYNAGTERVKEWKKRYPTEDRMLFLDLIPYKETRDYVALIARNYFWYHNLYGETFGLPEKGRAKRVLAANGNVNPGRGLIFTLFK